MLSIVHFAPLSWAELQKNGYRKTAGAMLKALWGREDIEQIWFIQQERRWGFLLKKYKVDAKLTVIGLPIGLPYERFALIRKVNRFVQALLLKGAIFEHTRTDRLIYWFYDWWNIEIISHLPKACTVMEITDMASHFISSNEAQQKHLDRVKAQVLNRVDYLFPVSTALVTECMGAQSKVTVLPNGIGRDFLELANYPQPDPVELKGIPHPRLCLVSTGWPLNYRINHDLLIQSLDRLPEWHLIIIGGERVETLGLRNLIQHPRVITIGLVPLTKLVSYIQHCDVCTVPYLKSEENTGDRLKIYEYLACKKPVLLSVKEGSELLMPYLHFAFDVDEFVTSCQNLFVYPSLPIDEIDSLLSQMTWEKRAETSLSIIANDRS